MDLLFFNGTRSCVGTRLAFSTVPIYQKYNKDLYLNLIGTYMDISTMEATRVTYQNSQAKNSSNPNTLGGTTLSMAVQPVMRQVVVKKKGIYFGVAIVGRN